MGLADMLIKMGITYGSPEAISICRKIATVMAYESLVTSYAMAIGHESTCPPLKDHYTTAYYMNLVSNINELSKDPELADVIDDRFFNDIEQLKLVPRHSQLLTIAPTGTLSTMLGISGGIEPIFANYYIRNAFGEDHKVYTPIVQEYMEAHGLKDDSELPEFFVTAQTLNYRDRIDMQALWQEFIDASISSTVNVPESFTVEETEDLYMYAWEKGLKGITMFRDNCARLGVLKLGNEKKEEKAESVETPIEVTMPAFDSIDPISRRELGTTAGMTYRVTCACGTMYITVNVDENGNMCEVFINPSKNGICHANVQGISRLIALSLRAGVKIDAIIEQIKGINCPACQMARGQGRQLDGMSCPDILARILARAKEEIKVEHSEEEMEIKPVSVVSKEEPVIIKDTNEKAKCPKCGTELQNTIGCLTCPECGWSKCE